jgi:spermidine synthase
MKNKAEILNREVWLETSNRFDLFAYGIDKVVATKQTAFQDVAIVDTKNFGRLLLLDGAAQSAEFDEALYHESLVHPAMLASRQSKRVLIIGGGEGATLREVLRHKDVESATMIDIDGELVELCKGHLPTWHKGSFSDKRSRVVIEDGRAFVEQNEEKYDVIIVDLVDMLTDSPAKKLYTREFYTVLKSRLNEGGALVVQGMEVSMLDSKDHASVCKTLKTAFKHVDSYKTFVPSFISEWGFILAGDGEPLKTFPAAKIDQLIEERIGAGVLQHLDGETMLSLFQMGRQIKQAIAERGSVICD